MKRILVVYYSQTGQLTEILKSLLGPLENAGDIRVTLKRLQPVPEYPFPWTAYEFCDVFPEAVAEIPCRLDCFDLDSEQDADLIILAYTVWYLSPSIPVLSFLQTQGAEQLLKNKPLITVVGCRNMWLMAHEKVKKYISTYQGNHLGNIVFCERTSNLMGIFTIAVWMLSGKKRPFLKIFPKPGISEQDIQGAAKFGRLISMYLRGYDYSLNQYILNKQGAVEVDPALMLMEKRVARVFQKWSSFIRKKGPAGDPGRSRRVYSFMIYLILAVTVLSPISRIAALVVQKLQREKISEEIDYYLQNSY